MTNHKDEITVGISVEGQKGQIVAPLSEGISLIEKMLTGPEVFWDRDELKPITSKSAFDALFQETASAPPVTDHRWYLKYFLEQEGHDLTVQKTQGIKWGFLFALRTKGRIYAAFEVQNARGIFIEYLVWDEAAGLKFSRRVTLSVAISTLEVSYVQKMCCELRNSPQAILGALGTAWADQYAEFEESDYAMAIHNPGLRALKNVFPQVLDIGGTGQY